MYFILYNSYAATEFDDDALKLLLIQARERNKELGITGMLFYFKEQFLQLIEGEQSAVELLAAKIANDPRHKHFLILKNETIETRFFADWSMGFRAISPDKMEDVENFKNLSDPNGKHTASFLYLLRMTQTESF